MNVRKWTSGAAAMAEQAQVPSGSETDTSKYLSGKITLKEYAQRLDESTPPAAALQRSLLENRDFVQEVATWLQHPNQAAPSKPVETPDSSGK